jgi:hypothetical protein
MDEQNKEGIVEEKATETTSPEKKQTGSIIGSIIVIIVIIVGGLYFWGTKSDDVSENVSGVPPTNIEPAEEAPIADPIGDALRKAAESDELNAIEADLNATDIDNIDSGADQI